MSQANIDTVRNTYAAFGRGDIGGILSALDASVVWRTPGIGHVPTGGRRTGHAQVTEFFGTVSRLVQFEKFEPQSIVADGDRVIVLGEDVFKVIGGSKTITEPWCHVFTFRDGKVVDFLEILDTAALAAELKSTGALATS